MTKMIERIVGLTDWESWFLALERATGRSLDGEGDQDKLNGLARKHGLPEWRAR